MEAALTCYGMVSKRRNQDPAMRGGATVVIAYASWHFTGGLNKGLYYLIVHTTAHNYMYAVKRLGWDTKNIPSASLKCKVQKNKSVAESRSLRVLVPEL